MTPTDASIPFLQQLGIEASLLPDVVYGTLITIRTQDYERRRNQIDAWFILVRHVGERSYFQVRMRGTGATI
jgi:hypothetical protein